MASKIRNDLFKVVLSLPTILNQCNFITLGEPYRVSRKYLTQACNFTYYTMQSFVGNLSMDALEYFHVSG